MNRILVAIALLAVTSVASAGGSVSFGIEYNSGGRGHAHGTDVVINHYPNGRVVVDRIPTTHVYPRGWNAHQGTGGRRMYHQGYEGSGTCYVDCWHNGVQPRSHRRHVPRGRGTSVHIGVGVTRTW